MTESLENSLGEYPKNAKDRKERGVHEFVPYVRIEDRLQAHEVKRYQPTETLHPGDSWETLGHFQESVKSYKKRVEEILDMDDENPQKAINLEGIRRLLSDTREKIEQLVDIYTYTDEVGIERKTELGEEIDTVGQKAYRLEQKIADALGHLE